jgi:N-acetylglucosamine kinase-like BadF-type ATPase
MKYLIVDAGSTKIEWVLLDGGDVIKRFTTQGFNPNYSDKQHFIDILNNVALPKDDIRDIYYYGSGCQKAENAQMVGMMLQQYFPNSVPMVTNDMMGAAHAVLGHEKGIACILGTGANSCLYDGVQIIDRAVSLGYIVGDEGSGSYIGRKLTRAHFYNLMPPELKLSFKEDYNLEISDFIDNVYHKPEASKYFAQFVKFADKNRAHPYIHQLLKDCFSDFIKVFVLRYEGCHLMPVSFVGSIAFYFQDILREALDSEGLAMGEVMQSPVDGLIKFHKR